MADRRPTARQFAIRRTVAVGVLVAAVFLLTAVVRAVWPDGPAPADQLVAAGTSAAESTATPKTPKPTPSTPVRTTSTATTTTPPRTYPKTGDGKVTILSVPRWTGANAVRSGARAVAYTIETEGGLGVPTDELITKIEATLHDKRGWQTEDPVRFVNVTPAQSKAGKHVDIRITLASPTLTDELCGPVNTQGDVSCNWGGRSVLNVKRWVTGVKYYGDDLDTYRTYVINHEVGHGLGYGHDYCRAKGKRANVMVPQTLGLQGCAAWPWPVGA